MKADGVLLSGGEESRGSDDFFPGSPPEDSAQGLSGHIYHWTAAEVANVLGEDEGPPKKKQKVVKASSKKK